MSEQPKQQTLVDKIGYDVLCAVRDWISGEQRGRGPTAYVDLGHYGLTRISIEPNLKMSEDALKSLRRSVDRMRRSAEKTKPA